jgi:catechol 2,3-dioxygenase-like lactoylglutathione lyase family enzyme
MAVRRLAAITLVVSDVARLRAFYEAGLGFRCEQAGERAATLALGEQRLQLVAGDGQAYPQPRTAADPWFQHFAIVVADMQAAYAGLKEQPGFAPISDGGPQLLPPSTGAITAFKFRDPDGHPLELSYFPPPVRGREWRDPAPGVVFQGMDHTALAVHDLDASLAFYRHVLGLQVGPKLTNTGPTQARLDGLDDPVVDIQILQPAGGGPHIELLAYRHPPSRPAPTLALNDIAATRTVLSVTGLDAILADAEVVTRDDGSALIRDPDGHLLQLQA